MNENCVVFKGNTNGILILLDENTSFEDIKRTLEKKVTDAKDFFAGANSAISFKGKKLSEDEELELLSIVSKKSGLNISFVNAEDTPKKAFISSPEPESNAILSDPKIQKVLTAKENITTFHKGSLRSGQAIEFNGSVIVIGDVNPGSKIKAAGNIIVLGKLKGVVHAGCNGSKDCFVSALYMNPTQLIIADIITYFPPDPDRVFTPEYAYGDNNEIFVKPLS